MAARPELAISEIVDGDVEEVVELWRRCGLTRPWNDPIADISFARRHEHATLLVGRVEGSLAASTMVGHDGHRGTVYYVSFDPDSRGHGFGHAIMQAAEKWLLEQGVSKLNLVVRAENSQVIDFYTAIGYAPEERINLAKWIDPAKKPAGRR